MHLSARTDRLNLGALASVQPPPVEVYTYRRLLEAALRLTRIRFVKFSTLLRQ